MYHALQLDGCPVCVGPGATVVAGAEVPVCVPVVGVWVRVPVVVVVVVELSSSLQPTRST